MVTQMPKHRIQVHLKISNVRYLNYIFPTCRESDESTWTWSCKQYVFIKLFELHEQIENESIYFWQKLSKWIRVDLVHGSFSEFWGKSTSYSSIFAADTPTRLTTNLLASTSSREMQYCDYFDPFLFFL